MMRSQNRPVTCQIVKIVHNDGDEEVDDQKGAEHVKTDKINIGEVGSARIFALEVQCVIFFFLFDVGFGKTTIFLVKNRR